MKPLILQQKVCLFYKLVAVVDEYVASEVEEKDCSLTINEGNFVLTSSEEEGGYLNAFLSEKLQSLCERSLEQIVGGESLKLEEIIHWSLDVTKKTVLAM